MKESAIAVSHQKAQSHLAILWGGLVAGILDISYAFVRSGMKGLTPTRVLQSVASGFLGQAAYTGGAATAALGLGFHFLIATTAAAVYYVASRWLEFLASRPVVFGPLYGILVYMFMNLVVIPLSAATFRLPFTVAGILPGLVVHMFLIGLPIALFTRRFSGFTPSATLATT